MLIRAEDRSAEKGHHFIEHRPVTCCLDVVRRDVGQPEQIIRAARPRAPTAGGMPPVLDIALDELPARGQQQMGAVQVGACIDQGHHVLELIAEADRAAGLVVAGAAPQARTHRLVQQPPVDDQVERVVGRVHGDRTQDAIPLLGDLAQAILDGLRRSAPLDERSHVVGRHRFAQQEYDASGLGRRQRDLRVQRRARIESGAHAVRQDFEGDARGRIDRSVAAEELRAVTGIRPHGFAAPRKPDASRVVHVPRIARDDGAGAGVDRGDDRQGPARARRTEVPLVVREQAQPPRPVGLVGDRHHHGLDRRVREDEDGGLLFDHRRHALEGGEAGAVPHNPAVARAAAQGARCGAPGLARLVIAHVDRLGRRVGDRIVGEWRQTVLATVGRPRERRARRGDHAAEVRVGKDVHPGRGRIHAAAEGDDVLAPVLGESADAIGHQRWRHHGRRGGFRPALRIPVDLEQARRRHGPDRRVELLGQLAAIARQDGARYRFEQHAVVDRQRVGAQQVDAAGPSAPAAPRLAVDQGHQRVVHLVEIVGGELVDDHQIGAERLQAPVFLRLQDLADECHVVLAEHPHEHDGQVARDAVGPQSGLALPVAREHFRIDAHRIVRVQHARGEPVVLPRQFGGHAEVLQQHLAVREGRGGRARRRALVAVAPGERQRGAPRLGRAGGERHAREPPRLEAQALPEAHHRIEDRAGRARQRFALERRGIRRRPAAPDELGAAGFPLGRRERPPLHVQHVEGPGSGLGRRSRAAAADERGRIRHVLGLHEQLAERWMGQVIGRRAEHDLGVAGDLDLARPPAAIGQRQASNLHIVLGRHHDVELRGDAVVGAAVDGLLRRERDVVVLRLATRGLVGGRPDEARSHVAQVQELAARVGRAVVAHARDRQLPPVAVAAARVGDDGDVRAVRQELRMRRGGVRRAVSPDRNARRRPQRARLLGGPRWRGRCVLRHPLLQQQFGGLHA